MDIKSYLSLNDKDKSLWKGTSLCLPQRPFFDKTVGDFFNNCVKPNIANSAWNSTVDAWNKMLLSR